MQKNVIAKRKTHHEKGFVGGLVSRVRRKEESGISGTGIGTSVVGRKPRGETTLEKDNELFRMRRNV